uniref:Transposon Ty3-I Gag-Pol polyprotein n=1 Tax=Cajanus cajan TaxID=3821 RepID=A0A151U141_CAJCA|nr:Transposon Ty3-I Gag-Pol polyprotein [Cajanus cajan]
MTEESRSALCKVILKNKDLFAWTPSDMPGVDPEVMCHKLSVCTEARPIAQRKRKMGTERKLAVETEVAKLLDAGFIREVHYTTWLANVVMVKKSNGKWRMCTDYTSLNKACPKDAYPLPNIDRLVDGASGHGVLSFLDAYSGYNQIPMHPRDEEKTAFITDSANYCYQVMPFGLKNAGATYQRLMNKVFQRQIGKNMEVYVDDMVVKSRNIDWHVTDLSEVFQQLRKYDMRLNPEKCVFGVSGGKFLGFMLSARGIEANPDKCMAIVNMISPQNLKQVQQLAGRLTALSRFLPCLAEITKPMVGLLRKAKKFEWSVECEEAFRTLKERLGSPPILSKPDPEVPIVVYLCVSNDTISTVLIQEKEGQQPIYFISRMLQEAETRYQLLEKVALGLVHTARPLRQYFQSHQIVVRTDCPIAKVLRKPELAGRMMAWSIELSEFDIGFQPRGPIRSQYLVDFINELQPRGCFVNDLWTIHVDGSSNNQGSGAAAKKLRTQAARYIVVGGELYRRGFSVPLLKCVDKEQANYILREMHEGICGFHSGGRTLATKVLRAGYYWPTLREDCVKFVKHYVSCQRHGNLIHASAEELHGISSPWPFAMWGMDILGPFPIAKGQCKFLLVAVDYFTKWVEAEPLASITTANVQKFLWKNIITRFGIPYALVTDNGLQFTDQKLNRFIQDLGIKHRFTSVEHPQANGQAEAANKVILGELKKRLGDAKGAWAEELLEVLWAYRCTPQSTTKETPFRLTYGTDAMIPVEVGEPSFRRQYFDENTNDISLRAEVDMVDEVRVRTEIIAEACKQRMARRFNSNLIKRSFKEGDLVWRVQGSARRNSKEGKLAANWDGPFRVRHSLENGAYKLEELSGKVIPRTWNASHLKTYYS